MQMQFTLAGSVTEFGDSAKLDFRNRLALLILEYSGALPECITLVASAASVLLEATMTFPPSARVALTVAQVLWKLLNQRSSHQPHGSS